METTTRVQDERGEPSGNSPRSASVTRETATTDQGAPRYSIARREFGAVEIPAVVQNVDRAVQAFGRVPSLEHVSADPAKFAATWAADKRS